MTVTTEHQATILGRVEAALARVAATMQGERLDDFLSLGEAWRRASHSGGPEHPAALGCLLWLVRLAWGCPGAYARESSRGGWVVCVRNLDPNGPVFAGPFRGPTERAALETALEAAPS